MRGGAATAPSWSSVRLRASPGDGCRTQRRSRRAVRTRHRLPLPTVKVLVIGGGARDHALCRSLSQDPAVTELHCAPGNAGITQVATVHPVDQLDGAAVAALARQLTADLVVVGPEAPLVAGV